MQSNDVQGVNMKVYNAREKELGRNAYSIVQDMHELKSGPKEKEGERGQMAGTIVLLETRGV